MRGPKDSHTWGRRPERTYYKQQDGQELMLGGVNGGVVLLRPCREDLKEMLESMPAFQGRDEGQNKIFMDGISDITSGKFTESTKEVNAQLSQFIISAQMPEAESEWSELLQDPSKVVVYHFSAKPKPLDLMLGSCHYSFKNEHPWHETKAQHHFAEAFVNNMSVFKKVRLEEQCKKKIMDSAKFAVSGYLGFIWEMGWATVLHQIEQALADMTRTTKTPGKFDEQWCPACKKTINDWRHMLCRCPVMLRPVMVNTNWFISFERRPYDIPTEKQDIQAVIQYLHYITTWWAQVTRGATSATRGQLPNPLINRGAASRDDLMKAKSQRQKQVTKAQDKMNREHYQMSPKRGNGQSSPNLHAQRSDRLPGHSQHSWRRGNWY